MSNNKPDIKPSKTEILPDGERGFILLWRGWWCDVMTLWQDPALLQCVKKPLSHSCILLLPLCLWGCKVKVGFQVWTYYHQINTTMATTLRVNSLVGWSSSRCSMSKMSFVGSGFRRLVGLEDSFESFKQRHRGRVCKFGHYGPLNKNKTTNTSCRDSWELSLLVHALIVLMHFNAKM